MKWEQEAGESWWQARSRSRGMVSGQGSKWTGMLDVQELDCAEGQDQGLG